MSAGNLHCNRQSWTAIWAFSSFPATPTISVFLGSNLCSPSNPGWRSCQNFQFRHAVSHSRAAMSVIPAISVDTLGDLGLQNRQSRHSQQPNRARQSWPAISVAISAIWDCNFGYDGTLSNPGSLGNFGRQSFQSQQPWPAKSSIFSISACNLPFSAGNVGNRGNLGRYSRRPGHLCQGRRSRYIRQSLLAFSVAISATSVSKVGKLGILVIARKVFFLGRQSLQSRQSRPAISSSFSIYACNHPFSAGHIGNPGNLGPQSRHSRQSWKYLNSRQSQQTLQFLQCRPTFSVAIWAISVRKFGILFTPSNSGNRGIFGRQPLQSRQSRPAISSFFFNLSMQSPILGRQYRKSRQSRRQFRRSR